ncbi:MAG: hypothetical protein ABIH26_09950 [Candidatus Eisenbacteria bacterium]
MTAIVVEHADVLGKPCDVLVLKYARGFHGVDMKVAEALGLSERKDGALSPGRFLRIPTRGKLPCKRVLFLGVPQLWDFGYAEIRRFSKDALAVLAKEDCEKASLAMTMHGAGYGLDEREAFSAQIAGLLEYLQSPDTDWRPEKIVIVERDANRAARLTDLLEAIRSAACVDEHSTGSQSTTRSLPDAGIRSDAKKHVFVAMPYDEEMQDIYEFGICAPVNAAGCLCERCDRSAFTGDVLDRIRKRIASATVVVADMTGANPNVYLEVGYAWGKGVPTLLLAREGQELQFDVRTHRCIFYKNISHLRKRLSDEMPKLTGGSPAVEAE